MKREWYDENFDKENMIDTSKTEKQEKVFELNSALKERVKKFPMNIVEFLIWIGLLLFCWSYIQSHPAEKSSLFSWLEVIVEKTKVKFSERTTGQWPELQNKFQLVRTFDEIISLAEWTPDCLTEEDVSKITRAQWKLDALSVEEFIEQERAFTTVANLFYTKIKEECSVQ